MSSSAEVVDKTAAVLRAADVPGPSAWLFPLGVLRARKNLLRAFTEMHRQWGNFVRFGVPYRRAYFINEPELIREVLVSSAPMFEKDRALKLTKIVLGEGLLTNEGASHRRQRKLAAPAFHKQRIASYAETMLHLSGVTAARWEDGARVDMDQEMMKLTLAIVAKTLFDADVNDKADDIGHAMEVLMTNFPRVANPFVRLTLMLPLKANKEIFDAKDRIDAVIYRLIGERRATGRDHGDLLSMLLAAQDEDDGTGMTDTQVRDEAITLFLAGHETTANVLAWAFYLLSQNPEAEARLHEEVDRAQFDGQPAMSLFMQLPYTRQVIAETMRLYPPAHTLARLLTKDMVLGGYALEKGATICFCPYIMHRDERYWPEPERFDPGRWTPEEEEKRPKFTYFPFGGGPRTCIGEQFAWMEGVLALARLAKEWRATLVPGHPIDTYPLITLRPRHGIGMTLHRR